MRKGSRVTEWLVAELRRRDALGRKKYGTTLDRGDLDTRDWLQHLLEELLDAAGYVKRIMCDMEKARGQRKKP